MPQHLLSNILAEKFVKTLKVPHSAYIDWHTREFVHFSCSTRISHGATSHASPAWSSMRCVSSVEVRFSRCDDWQRGNCMIEIYGQGSDSFLRLSFKLFSALFSSTFHNRQNCNWTKHNSWQLVLPYLSSPLFMTVCSYFPAKRTRSWLENIDVGMKKFNHMLED